MSLKRFIIATSLALASLASHAGAKEDIQADMLAGRWAQADGRLEDVLKKHPDNALAHYWRAEVKFKLGEIEAAQTEARKAQEIDPSEKFAGNKAMLSRILHAKPTSAKSPLDAAAGGLPPTLDAPRATLTPPAQASTGTPAPRADGKAGFGASLLFAVLVVGGLGWWFVRTTSRKQLLQKREQWAGSLNEASKDLTDAIAASDANPLNSPEVRLGNYDRAKKAQAELATHQASLGTRTDFAQTRSLVARSHDIAAEIRGEERPSDKAARLEQERLAAMRAQAPLQQPYGTPVPSTSGGAGVLGTVAAVGAGLAIGSLLSGRAEASQRHSSRATDFEPIDNDPADSIDVSGVDAGNDSWGDGGGSVDLGGGGDGGSFD